MLRNLSTRMALQITLVIFLVVSASGVLTFVRVSRAVEETTERRFSEAVVRGAAQARVHTDEIERLMIAGASLLATGPAFIERFAAGDSAAVVAMAQAQRSSIAQALPQETSIFLYDAQGRPLPSRETTAAASPLPHIRPVLSGTPTRALRYSEALGLVFSGAAPVRAPDGRVLGVIEVAARADDKFTRHLAELAGAEVAIVTETGTAARSSQDIDIREAELSAHPAAQQQPVSMILGGEPYLAMVVPLRDIENRAIGLLYVGVDSDEILAEQRGAQREILTATAIAMTIGALMAVGLGILFTRPVTALARAARRIQENDLQSPVPRVGPSELRELGEAMDEMRLAIRDAHENLVGANARLAERAEASAAGLAAVSQELTMVHGVTIGIAHFPGGSSRVVVEQVPRLEWVDGACVLVHDGEAFVVDAEHGLRSGAADALVNLLRRQSIAVPEDGLFIENADVRGVFQALVPLGFRSAALLPLVAARDHGLLVVTAERATEFTESRRSLLQAVRSELATALDRFELAHEVEENRRLAESVLREMQDGAVVIDDRGTCIICNPAAGRLLRVDADAVAGRPIGEWMPIAESTLERIRRGADGRTDTPDVLFEQDGRLLSFTAGPLIEPDGRRRGVILLLRDVTETVAAERLKQDFVSMVGHELRTPLTLIRTSIDLLTEQGAGALTPTQRRITDVLHNNSDRLLRLINDLLDMSALDSGRMRVHHLPVDLHGLIEEVVSTYEHEAEDREITLTLDIGVGPVTVWADRARLGQVLSNLMDNALKYTPSGGHITLSVDKREEDVLVRVADNGIGILPSEQPLLFQKFQRTRAGERQSGGTGLGLAIARSIVELHGGKIWCESDGKSGSTFSFTVPNHDPDTTRA